MIDDFVIATEIHLQGLRAVYEPEAIAVEDANRRARDEFRMRVRVIKQTLSALHRYRHTLNPFRHKMFAFQMIAHKALRYAVPFLLIAAFIASGWASGSVVWLRFAFIGQLALYGAAIAGFIRERRKTQARAPGDPLLLRAGQRRVTGRLFESSARRVLCRLGADSRSA